MSDDERAPDASLDAYLRRVLARDQLRHWHAPFVWTDPAGRDVFVQVYIHPDAEHTVITAERKPSPGYEARFAAALDALRAQLDVLVRAIPCDEIDGAPIATVTVEVRGRPGHDYGFDGEGLRAAIGQTLAVNHAWLNNAPGASYAVRPADLWTDDETMTATNENDTARPLAGAEETSDDEN